MSVQGHTRETLGDVANDLRALAGQLDAAIELMDTEKVEVIPVSHNKTSMTGRLALHRFAMDAMERVRRAVYEKRVRGVTTDRSDE